MKVVHIASGDTWAGAERVISILLEAQQRESDLECEAVLLNDGRLAEKLRGSGVPVHIIPEQGRSFVSLVRALRAHLRGTDVVHAHRYKEIIASALALAPYGRRLVVTVHGLQPAAQLSRAEAVQVWGALWLARIASARIACVSAELGERLARVLGAANVHVVPNPAPRPSEGAFAFDLRERLGWMSARPVVGFVGRLEHVKGPDLLLEIADEVEADVGFVFIGEGSMEAELRSAVRGRGLDDRVGFVGPVPDAMPLIRQLSVLALPSRHEGLPMALLEAAVLGRPVVAFDVGGVRQVLDGGPAATVVQPGDISGFSRELERMIGAGHELDEDVARWAEPVRERFDTNSIVASYRELYQLALGRERM